MLFAALVAILVFGLDLGCGATSERESERYLTARASLTASDNAILPLHETPFNYIRVISRI